MGRKNRNNGKPTTNVMPGAENVTTSANVDAAAIIAARIEHANADVIAPAEQTEESEATAAASAADVAQTETSEPAAATESTTTEESKPAADGGDGVDDGDSSKPAAAKKTETEREKRDRERTMKAADKRVTKAAESIIKMFDERDREERAWWPKTGAKIAAMLRDAVDSGVSRKTALARLKNMALAALGGDIIPDVNRALQLAGALDYFGASFATLPTRTQKSLASLFDLADEIGTNGKPTGHKSYTLAKLADDDASRVFAWAMGEDIDSCPINNPTYTRDKTLSGPDADALIQAVKAAASASTKTTEDGKPASGATNDVPPVDGKGSANTPATTTTKTKDAKTERVDAVPRLPVKPMLAAAEMVKMLMAHDDKVAVFSAMGHCKEISVMLMDALFVGMGEAGRVDDMLSLAASIERECSIADYVATHGEEKTTRADAVAALKAKSPGLFAAA